MYGIILASAHRIVGSFRSLTHSLRLTAGC